MAILMKICTKRYALFTQNIVIFEVLFIFWQKTYKLSHQPVKFLFPAGPFRIKWNSLRSFFLTAGDFVRYPKPTDIRIFSDRGKGDAAVTSSGPPRRGSIQVRIILLAMLFTLLAALVILVTSMNAVAARLERTTLQSVEYALETAGATIRSNIEEVDSLAGWCVSNASIRTWLLSAEPPQTLTQNVYTQVSGKFSSMRTVTYLQRFMPINAGGGYMSFGTNSTQSAAMQTTLSADAVGRLPGFGDGQGDTAWQSVVRDPLMLPERATAGIPVTRTFRDTSGHVGRVYIAVSTALITDSLRDFTAVEGGQLYWVMDGVLYAVSGNSPLAADRLAHVADYTPHSGETLDAATRLYSAEVDGQRMLVVSYPVGLHELYLAEAIPMAPSGTVLLSLLAGPAVASPLIVLALGVALALLLHRLVATPILLLQRQIERLGSGDLTPDPALEWDNELGDIGRGVNHMAQNITALMEKRLEDERQKQDLEYRMLQNQINPHFIYNTLNSIKWMATIQRVSGIAEMTTALSRLLKSLSKGSERLVPLYEEFALINDYFTIQQYRYGGTITLEVDYIEDERLARTCLIPRFTLQPLVENAIFHGIEPRGQAGSILMRVVRDTDSTDVLLYLQDDGVGMTPEQAARALSEPGPEEEAVKFRHVGLWNVHRRLQYSFGEAYGLSIESAPGAGTTVIVRLPCREGGGAQ